MTTTRSSHGVVSITSHAIQLRDTVDGTKSARSTDVALSKLESLRYSPFAVGLLPTDSDLYSVKVFKNPASSIDKIDSIQVITTDETFGDDTCTYVYNDYRSTGIATIPFEITRTAHFGRVVDTVHVASAAVYPEATVERLAEGIFGVVLRSASTRSLVVEFEDFLLVSGAPLNTHNGMLILKTIQQQISKKPVRYFTYGHFHPHYTGGVRGFVDKGAVVLCPEASASYIEQIVMAQHTFTSDSLPKAGTDANIQRFTDSVAISDGNMSVILYTIGASSAHTDDYTLLYIPRHRLLFQDDSAWIPESGSQESKSARQNGLLKSIVDLSLDVKIVVQAWPVFGFGVKTKFGANEL